MSTIINKAYLVKHSQEYNNRIGLIKTNDFNNILGEKLLHKCFNDKYYDECLDTYNEDDAKQGDAHAENDDGDDEDEHDLRRVDDD